MAAGHAVVAHNGAVEFVHFFTASELVQAVDVLRDDGTELAFALQLSEFEMHSAWAVVWCDHFCAIEVEEFFGVGIKKAAAEHGLRVVLEALLMIEPILAAKIRDAAFGGDAGAAEEDDCVGIVDDLF